MMSSAVNVSAPRATTNAVVPQLSKRALDGLEKGASVEIWARCQPYSISLGDIAKTEYHKILCLVHTAKIRYFSRRCKRELAANDRKRVTVPFMEEPTRLVVSWMMAGGGDDLGTAYPKNELRKLEILKDLATYWEIDSLVDLIDMDIAAAIPILPAVPTAKSALKAPAKKAVPEKICWSCNKLGHMRRDCTERSAVHVTWSQAETHSMKGADPAAETSGHSRQKLTPFSGRIAARDPSGITYNLEWRQVELVFEGPRADGRLKITGTVNLSLW